MKIILTLTLISLLLAYGCSHSAPHQSNNPTWVDELIAKFQSDPVGNPPQSIYKYEYEGQTVYYVPPQCCDQFSELYDANGSIICAPDGGLTGSGDNRCPDFFNESTNESLIWNDSRTK
jgi:hypothetical protein